MARTVICFLVEGHGLRRLPRKLMEHLHGGTQALPEYARTTQKLIHVFVEYKRKEPQQIIMATGYYYAFDRDGHLAHIDGNERYPRWELSDEDIKKVSARIWKRPLGPRLVHVSPRR